MAKQRMEKDSDTIEALQQVLATASRRVAVLETLYGRKSETDEGDERWEVHVQNTTGYKRKKKQVLQEDKYGEDEMGRFLVQFKSKFRRIPSTITIQAWWRMVHQRGKFLRIRRRRWLRKQDTFTKWHFHLKVMRIMRKSTRRRYLFLWREVVDEILDARRVLLKMTESSAQGVLSKLQDSGNSFGLSKQKAPPPSRKSETGNSKEDDDGIEKPPGIRETLAQIQAQKELMLQERMRLIAELKQKQKAWNAWKAYLRYVHNRRVMASMHLLRMRRTPNRTEAHDMWLGERLQICFTMWYRWSRIKRSKRLGETKFPTFATNVPLWNQWMKKFAQLEALKVQAKRIGPLVRLRRYFVRMVNYTRHRKRKAEYVAKAKEKYEYSRQYFIMRHWFAYARRRGAMLREKRKILLAWYEWSGSNRKLRTISQYISTNLRSMAKRGLIQKWRKRLEDVRTLRVFHTDKLLNKVTSNLWLALYTVYLWKRDYAHSTFLETWKTWKSFCRRRRSWKYIKFAYQRYQARKMQSICFSRWKASYRNKGQFVNNKRKRTVIEIRYGEQYSNQDVKSVQDLQNCIVQGARPMKQWALEDERDDAILASWLRKDDLHLYNQRQPGGSRLHACADEGDLDGVMKCLQQLEQLPEKEKLHDLDEQKRKMQIEMRKSIAIQQVVIVKQQENEKEDDENEEEEGDDTFDDEDEIDEGRNKYKFVPPVKHDKAKYAEELGQYTKFSDYAIDLRDENGATPLHLAARHVDEKYFEVVLVLVQAGASVFAKDRDGRTPLDVAIEPKIVAFLAQHMDRIDKGDFTSTERRAYRELKNEVSWRNIDATYLLQLVVDCACGSFSFEQQATRKFINLLHEGKGLPGSIDELERLHETIISSRMEAMRGIQTRDNELLRRGRVRDNLRDAKLNNPMTGGRVSVAMEFLQPRPYEPVGKYALVFRGGQNEPITMKDGPVTISQKPLFPAPTRLHSILSDPFPNKRSGGKGMRPFFHHRFHLFHVLAQFKDYFLFPGDRERNKAFQITSEAEGKQNHSSKLEKQLRKLWIGALENHEKVAVKLEREGSELNCRIMNFGTKMRNAADRIKALELELNDLRKNRKTAARTMNAGRKQNVDQSVSLNKQIDELEQDLQKNRERLIVAEREISTFIKRGAQKTLRFKTLQEERASIQGFIEEGQADIANLKQQLMRSNGTLQTEFNHQIKHMNSINKTQSSKVEEIETLNHDLLEFKRLQDYFRDLAKQLRQVWTRICDNIDEEKFKIQHPWESYVKPDDHGNSMFAVNLVHEEVDIEDLLRFELPTDDGEDNHDKGERANEDDDDNDDEEEEEDDNTDDDKISDHKHNDDDDADYSGRMSVKEDRPKTPPKEKKLETSQTSIQLNHKEKEDDDESDIETEVSSEEDEGMFQDIEGEADSTPLEEDDDDDQESHVNDHQQKRLSAVARRSTRRISRAEVRRVSMRKSRKMELDQDPIMELAKALEHQDPEAKQTRRSVRKEEAKIDRRFRRQTMIGVSRSVKNGLLDREQSERRVTQIFQSSRTLLFNGEVVMEEKKFETEQAEVQANKEKYEEEERQMKKQQQEAAKKLRQELAVFTAEKIKRQQLEEKKREMEAKRMAARKTSTTVTRSKTAILNAIPTKTNNAEEEDETMKATVDVNAQDPDYFFANFVECQQPEEQEAEEIDNQQPVIPEGKGGEEEEEEEMKTEQNPKEQLEVKMNAPVLWKSSIASSVSIKEWKETSARPEFKYGNNTEDPFMKFARDNVHHEWIEVSSHIEFDSDQDDEEEEVEKMVFDDDDNNSVSSSSNSSLSTPMNDASPRPSSCYEEPDVGNVKQPVEIQQRPSLIENTLAITHEENEVQDEQVVPKTVLESSSTRQNEERKIWNSLKEAGTSNRHSRGLQEQIEEQLQKHRELLQDRSEIWISSSGGENIVKRPGLPPSLPSHTLAFLKPCEAEEKQPIAFDPVLTNSRPSKSSKSSRTKPVSITKLVEKSPRRSVSSHAPKRKLSLHVGLPTTKSDAELPLFSDVPMRVGTPTQQRTRKPCKRTKLEPLSKPSATTLLGGKDLLVVPSSSSSRSKQPKSNSSSVTTRVTPFRGLSQLQAYMPRMTSSSSDGNLALAGSTLVAPENTLHGSFETSTNVRQPTTASTAVREAYNLLNPNIYTEPAPPEQ